MLKIVRTRGKAAAKTLAVLCLPVGLAACGDVERDFGLVRDAPDEFTVETRAPLSMPPSYAIRAPEPGAPRPQEVTAPQAAEAALAPDTALGAAQAGPETNGQQALVQEAGPPAPPGIRQKVEAEAANDRPSRSITDRLLFWKSPPPPGAPLDPVQESQRLRENAALGQPPTAGDTIIQDKPKSSFLGIF
jgi:hypothetical protein